MIEHYGQDNRRNTYTLFDVEKKGNEINWHWDLHLEVFPFEKMWKEGVSIFEIARILEKNVDSIRLLKMDRMRRGRIKPRPYDDYGNVETFLKEFAKPMKKRNRHA